MRVQSFLRARIEPTVSGVALLNRNHVLADSVVTDGKVSRAPKVDRARAEATRPADRGGLVVRGSSQIRAQITPWSLRGKPRRRSVRQHQLTSDPRMSRITITLSEVRYRALKEASAKRSKTIGQLIEESLEFYGIRSEDETRSLIERAREHAGMAETDALEMAVTETRAARRGE